MILRVEFQSSVHRLNSLGVILGGFMEQGNIDEYIDFVQILLSFLGLLESPVEEAERLVHLASVL